MKSIQDRQSSTWAVRTTQGAIMSAKQRRGCRWMIGLVALLPLAPAYAGFETILGNVDGVFQQGSGEMVVRGWACWTDAPGASPNVDLYVGNEREHGGTKIGTFASDQPNEPAVDQVCGTQNRPHRFIITLNTAVRQQYAGQPIYVYGVPWLSFSSYVLLGGSGQYRVPDAPAVSDSVYYIHTDRLGSNVIMTDANANVVAKTDYKAYGAAGDNQQKSEAPGYTGHYEDPLTGLTYMQQRYYDADLGRFISIDPVASRPGDVFNFNRYAYANNNPLSFVDPDGQDVGNGTPVTVQGYYWDNARRTFYNDGGWGGASFGRGGSYGVGGGAGAGGGIRTEKPVNVTADRPPDIVRQEFFGFMPQDRAFASMFESIYGGWNRFMRLFQKGDLNISLGVGAAGQAMPDYADVEVGMALDANGTFCLYDSGSAGAGLGGIWGAAGPSAGAGIGALTSGTQTSYGTYWQGGEGFFGEGKITYSPGSGGGYARGLGGVSVSATGGSMGAGTFVNKTTYRCF